MLKDLILLVRITDTTNQYLITKYYRPKATDLRTNRLKFHIQDMFPDYKNNA